MFKALLSVLVTISSQAEEESNCQIFPTQVGREREIVRETRWHCMSNMHYPMNTQLQRQMTTSSLTQLCWAQPKSANEWLAKFSSTLVRQQSSTSSSVHTKQVQQALQELLNRVIPRGGITLSQAFPHQFPRTTVGYFVQTILSRAHSLLDWFHQFWQSLCPCVQTYTKYSRVMHELDTSKKMGDFWLLLSIRAPRRGGSGVGTMESSILTTPLSVPSSLARFPLRWWTVHVSGSGR